MSAIILRYTNANSITTPSANRSAVFVDENGALAIKNDTGNITSFEVGPAGNTQVFFNANGNFEGSANFTFSSSTNVLTVLGNIAATRVLTDNLLHANGAVWDLELPAGANWQIQFNNNNSFGATGNLQMLGGTQLLVGATASNVDFPSARVIASQDNVGNSSTDNVGIAAEAVANSANSSVTGIGVLGHARANGATKGTGMQGQAFVTASGDTGAAVGVRAYAIDTHSGGYNIGFLGNAMNSGVGNYAFYVQNGGIASIENNTFWDLNDNSNAALTFNSTGKANIFGIETTDNSEGIFTSGYLNVTGNIAAAGIKTNNYYYANGSPVDFQQAAGSNTQIQYNNANDFGASANFTFNSATNVLTVTGNISTGNVSATGAVNAATLGGSLTTAAQGNITSVGTLTSLTVSGNITSGNIDGGNLVKGNYVQGTLTTAAQPNITSVGTLSSASVTGNVTAGNVYANSGTVGASLLTGTLTTNAQPNVTSVGTLSSLTVTGNVGAGNLNATSAVVASTLTSNVSTGTAPLTVTSTTRVANLNVNYANVSDFNVITAQSTGIYYPTFINGNSTANYALAANAGFSANLANGGLIATTFVGNVSGNITGTLANGTSSVSIPASNGNVNISVAGNANIVAVTGTGVNVAGTLNATGNANVNNLGTAQVLATANVTAPTFISNVAQGTAPLTVTSNTKVTNFNADLLDGYDTATSATANTVVVRNADGNITGNNITGTLTTASQTNITSVGTLGSLSVTANITAGNVYANTGTIGASLLTGTLTTAAQPNVTSLGTLSSLTVTGNITGGNLLGPHANGNSNVNIPAAAGNINLSVNGNTNILVVTGTGVNVAGTLNATGNANVGNLGVAFVGATANVTAPTFVSNIATGTAPFTVSSTTKVANLNADTVDGYDTATAATANTVVVRDTNGNITGNNIAGTLTTASQTNITSVGTLGSLAVTANITAGNVYANTGTIGASLLTGTLTTAAQPNITSVGTLSSLSVTANVSAGNLTTSGVLSVTGTGVSSIAGNLDMTSNTIINLATPTNATDAATKQYVDDVAQGLNVHDACYAATANTLAIRTGGTITYNNGSSGVGANLVLSGSPTANYIAANCFDANTTAIVGSRILVKNEANAVHNGIYVVDSATVLTRATDYDSVPEVEAGDFVFVTDGDNYNDTGWVQTSTVTAIGTAGNNIVFTQFSGAGTYSAGTGLTLTGTTFSITNTAVSAASYGNGDRVASFTVNSQGQLTAASNVVIAANAANLTGTTLATSIVTSSLTTVGTLGSLTVTGNTTVGNLIGPHANGNSNINIPAVNGNVNISAVGNANILVVTGTGVNVAGTLNATGNANVNNLGTAQVLASANVTTPQFISNISTGTAPLVVSSTTKVANLNADTVDGYDTATAATANTIVVRDTNGNITGNNITGTLVTASQTNITSVGTLSSLTIAANGNITMSGTGSQLSGANLVSATNLTGTLTTAAQPNITSLGTLTGLGVNGNITAANITANTGVFTGNGSGLSQLAGANVTGTVANATHASTANTVTNAAQGNITSVGTLTSLGVSGTITAANITANTGIFTGNGSGLSQLTGANVTGTVANATFATSATSATNAAAVLTNTSTNTTVYLTGTNSSANGNVALEKVTGIYANMGNNAITATTFVGALSGNATTAGTVVTAAQPNITSVGTLTSLSIDGNLTFTGVARRILADFSNSNRANRGMFQTSTADSPSRVGVIPNGTNTVCEFSLYNSSDPANAGIGNLLLNATEFRLTAGNSGSGTQIPMTFYAGGSEQMRIITGGNVGIGNTAPTHKLSVTGTMNVSGNANVGNIGATSGEFTTVNVSGNITGPNHIANTGFFISSVTTGISAAGTVQGNATALTTMFNVVSTVNSGTGVVLPTAVAGMRVTVMNTGGNTLNVYPAVNGIINSAAANIAYSLNAGGRLDFCAVSTTQWYTLSATYA